MIQLISVRLVGLSNTKLLVIGFFLAGVLLGCGSSGPVPQKTPETKVAALLGEHRVVMLGDCRHTSPQPYQSLLGVLEAWSDDLRTGENAPPHLTLVLEKTPEYARLISDFTETGNWGPLLDYLLPEFSLETLEFYAGLRRIRQELAGWPESKSSSLWIIGEEPESTRQPVKRTEQETLRFVIDKRDSLTAAGILNHLRKYPNRKLLIFYGNLHLASGRVAKFWEGSPGTAPDEHFGFWLPHYLRRDLEKDEVLTIDQIGMPLGRETRGVNSADKLVTWDEVPLEHPWKQDPEQARDMAILRYSTNASPHPLKYVACRPVIEAMINELHRVEPLLGHSQFADWDFAKFQDGLTLLTGFKFDTAIEWSDWWSPDKFDGLALVRSESFARRVTGLIKAATAKDSKAPATLLELGLSRSTAISIARGGTTELQGLWQGELGQILALQSIGIWWCGDEVEKINAYQYIREFSGVNFSTPDEALKWWRHKYQGVDY